MQSSHHGSKQKRTPMPLPWGQGSMSFHGRVWRLTYRDPEGQIHWENANTADAVEAQRILAKLALPRAQAMVKALRAIIDGQPYQGDAKAGAAAGGQRTGRGTQGTRQDRQATGKGGAR